MYKRLTALLLAALLLLGALSGCGSVLDALEDRLETTAEPEPSLPSGDYLTEGLYFYGSWRADTDYSDMYAYSDLDYFRSLGEELLSVAASGPDEEALYDACFAFTDEFYYIRTASDLRDLEYYRDPSDEAASAARAEAYEALYEAEDYLWDTMHEATLLAGEELMAAACGEAQASSWASWTPGGSGADNGLASRERELVDEYYALITQPVPDVEAICGLYAELVGVRREQAALSGYANYAEHAYSGFARDYGPEAAQPIWAAAKEHFVPLLADYAAALYGLMDSAARSCTEQEALEALSLVAGGISPETAEACEYLLRHGLYDFEALDTKPDMGFTTVLYWYNEPFIFNSPAGDLNDYTNTFHEFGHFLNFYGVPSDLIFGVSDNEISEMQSIGMELMATHWYGEIFGPDADGALANLLFNLITSVLDGALYDEFQQRVYAEEGLTPERIPELYAEVYESYGYEPYEGFEYEWVYVSHNFEMPFYYISYCMSAIPVLELLDLLRADPGAAAELYMQIAATDPELYYCSEAVSELGLPDPLDPAAYAEAADTLRAELESLAA